MSIITLGSDGITHRQNLAMFISSPSAMEPNMAVVGQRNSWQISVQFGVQIETFVFSFLSCLRMGRLHVSDPLASISRSGAVSRFPFVSFATRLHSAMEIRLCSSRYDMMGAYSL